MKRKLELTALVIGALGGLGGFGALAHSTLILPWRMTAAETAIKEMQTAHATDHDILIHIEGRVESIQENLGISQQKQNPK